MSNTRIHLLSCPDCRRQLDVTALQPGDEVMCVCDRRLTVGAPKLVTVRALSCKRCGGAVGESETECGFCGAALSAEDRIASTICPACTTRIPNDSRHCKACGVELRTAAVPPLPADGKCPRCEGRLRVHLLEDAELIECADEGGCGGVWCSRETFDRLQSRAETGGSGPEVEPPGLLPTGPSNGRAYVPCITCGNLMQRRQFRYGGRASGIVLDVCRDHGVWFDRDELQAALTVVRRSRRAVSTSGPATSGEAASGKPAHRTSVEPFPSTGGSGWILGDLGDLFELVLESIRDLNPFD